jgi:hypothetical protein
MGKKVKNATSIFGNEAGKITKEIVRVENMRVVKTTLCNDRSSRSHCLVGMLLPGYVTTLAINYTDIRKFSLADNNRRACNRRETGACEYGWFRKNRSSWLCAT